MARVIKWGSILVVILLALALAVPFMIPLDRYRHLAEERVKALTGRDMVIGGAISPSLWPNPGIRLAQVSLANPAGFTEKNMAEIGTLTAEVELMPLLHGEVRIRQFIATQPVIHLEINKQGKSNWQFTHAASAQEKPAVPAAGTPKTASLPVLGLVKIENGTLTYRDQRSQQAYSADGIDLTLAMPAPTAPLELAAAVNWNKERLSLSAHIDQPAELAASGSALKAELKAGALAAVAFAGNASLQQLKGNIDASSNSLVKLAQWAGASFDWKGATPLSLSVEGPLSCTLNQCALTNGDIALDAIKAHGDLAFTSGPTPQLDATLATDLLDANPYLPAEKHATLTLISAAEAAEWSNEKIDLSALRTLNANVALTIGKLICRSLSVSQLGVNARLQNGELALRIPHFETYGGSGSLNLNATAANRLAADFTAQHMQIEQPLKDFAQFDRLSGLTELKGSLSAQGPSQRALVQSLSGNGSIRLTDGAIRGIDLAQLVRNARSLITGADTSAQKTDFSELSGSYTITNGIVSNSDLAMKAPLLRLRGEGTVDLPQQLVHYRLLPSLVGTLQGQGGKDKTGLEVPMRVEGSFDRLTFTPDLQSLATDTLKDPEKMKETVRNLKGEVKNLKDSIKGQGRINEILKGFR